MCCFYPDYLFHFHHEPSPPSDLLLGGWPYGLYEVTSPERRRVREHRCFTGRPQGLPSIPAQPGAAGPAGHRGQHPFASQGSRNAGCRLPAAYYGHEPRARRPSEPSGDIPGGRGTPLSPLWLVGLRRRPRSVRLPNEAVTRSRRTRCGGRARATSTRRTRRRPARSRD